MPFSIWFIATLIIFNELKQKNNLLLSLELDPRNERAREIDRNKRSTTKTMSNAELFINKKCKYVVFSLFHVRDNLNAFQNESIIVTRNGLRHKIEIRRKNKAEKLRIETLAHTNASQYDDVAVCTMHIFTKGQRSPAIAYTFLFHCE